MLNIKEVHSGYGKLKILRGINLNVPQGGVVALLGGNGTGKSTLLKTISGLVPVMEGSIEFDGQIISGKKPHEIVRSGLVQVTQSKEAYPAMTVEENLMLGAFTRSDSGGVRADLEKVYEFFPVLRQRRKVLSDSEYGASQQPTQNHGSAFKTMSGSVWWRSITFKMPQEDSGDGTSPTLAQWEEVSHYVENETPSEITDSKDF